MKILVFTDVHGNKELIKRLVILSQKVDLMVCCGDISNFGYKLDYILSVFNKTVKKLLIIPGNHESSKNIEMASKKYNNIINVHKKIYFIEDYLFLGYGGGGFSKEDKGFEEFIYKTKKVIKDNPKIILITHAPVYNTKTDYLPLWDGNDKHRGNNSIRRFVEKFNVKFAFCGHFHENLGKKDKIKESYIINPGFGKIIVI